MYKIIFNIIEIQGYLKTCFQPSLSDKNRFLGVITDGRFKLDICLYHSGEEINPKFERGKKLEIIGDLQERGICYICIFVILFKELLDVSFFLNFRTELFISR